MYQEEYKRWLAADLQDADLNPELSKIEGNDEEIKDRFAVALKFILISPEELRIPSYIREDVLKKNNIEFQEVERLEDALPDLDILYMTRVQKERFFNEEDYVRMKDFYILDKQKMELAKKDMYILHPLPRVNEISTEVDADPRAAYFKQAQYGVYVRMALILTLLEVKLPC